MKLILLSLLMCLCLSSCTKERNPPILEDDVYSIEKITIVESEEVEEIDLFGYEK